MYRYNTEAIHRALAAAAAKQQTLNLGSVVVVFPTGRWLSGPIALVSVGGGEGGEERGGERWLPRPPESALMRL